MKKIVSLNFIIASFTIMSCSSQQHTQSSNNSAVQYTAAKNYFVKNTYEANALQAIRLTSSNELNQYFGGARTMDSKSVQTNIDFEKNNAIALIYPKTDSTISIKITSVQSNTNNLLVHYKLKKGVKTTYSIVPFSLIILDKKYVENIQLVED
ncbi:hypothetical protein [Rhizosphaericola mali]|uniref:Uncharacterized protein n=1 Tax=Rhizosphaericola mali TaxID=2545455 RepID=A0A5P2G671_9BACT|nr:hypothetical protein [Rhizosphaericola mali]QES89402.1 hypothetical protein E0W69_012255 [Rhizosphaericola mali]